MAGEGQAGEQPHPSPRQMAERARHLTACAEPARSTVAEFHATVQRRAALCLPEGTRASPHTLTHRASKTSRQSEIFPLV